MNLPSISTSSSNAFINSITALPLLEEEEERELFSKIQQGCVKSRDKIIRHSLKYVIAVARKRYASAQRRGIQLDDLVQEGAIGLLKAIPGFDPNRGYRFITFASMHVKGHISEHIRHFLTATKLYTTKPEKKAYCNMREIDTYRDIHEAAEVYGVSVDDIINVKGRMQFPLSFSTAETIGDSENPIGLIDVEKVMGATPDAPALLAAEESADDKIQTLRVLLNELNPRQREIITRRWLQETNVPTLTEMGHEYGISAERVRQIEKEGIVKMKKVVEVLEMPEPA